jgi:neutral ceramidase
MGYARLDQFAQGIHQRLRARAFIIAELDKNHYSRNRSPITHHRPMETPILENNTAPWRASTTRIASKNSPNEPDHPRIHGNKASTTTYAHKVDPQKTICFVSIDAGMGSDLLNMRVRKRLQELLPEISASNDDENNTINTTLCHLENLSISATHTHSAPGGFLQYVLYQMTSFGFSDQVVNAYTEGIAQAILRAYKNLQPASIGVAEGLLYDANINRSPTSYLLNPESERNEYPEGDTDKNMIQLSFEDSEKKRLLGILNWFSVHCTSMNSTNRLISGDNKGYASYLAERLFNGNETVTGTGDFVAAFASTNLGDVSPNTDGPKCIDTGLPCDLHKSTCDGSPTYCIASGPGRNMIESTEIIGRRQFEHSLKLLDNISTYLNGKVEFRHSFIDMSNITVTLDDGSVVHTCPAALGYGFAGGTTDGPGDFPFTQAINKTNPFWDMVGGFLSTPDASQIKCQHPKPILLNTGKVDVPYKWDPDIVPISIFRIGNFIILNVPSEFTTMAGRRLRKSVVDVFVNGGVHDPVVTIAGLANSYTHYVATLEEYQAQRYEAASTLYGPHTLSAYIQEFRRIATDLMSGASSNTTREPKDLSGVQISLIPPLAVDLVGLGKTFGSVAVDSEEQYRVGDTVLVSFRSANPRNNLRLGDTFLTVDSLDHKGQWQTIYVDSDWCTRFHWKGGCEYWGTSFAEISWNIPDDTPQGLYRICHRGTRKTFLGQAEEALYRAPASVTTDLMGSYAVTMILQLLKLSVHFSRTLMQSVERAMAFARTSDFEGCSRTFLVLPKI